MRPDEPFDVIVTGRWLPGEIETEWRASSRQIVPEVEAHIAEAWDAAQAKLGEKLFDGPMCRLEAWANDEARGALKLTLSRTGYRTFLGTSLTGRAAEWIAEFGDVLARPVGVSAALITSDDQLLLGRRNDSVAYYPRRLHPFAGSLEPRDDLDVFDEVRRELREELSLESTETASIACNGIVEDRTLRHPEMIFTVRSSRSLLELRERVHDGEHQDAWHVPATADAIAAALADPTLPFTPVARATMLLFDRGAFGAGLRR